MRMNTVHWRSRSALLVLVVALVGCASDRDEAGGPVDGGEVTVVAFTAEPPRIGVGQASRLRWQTENATRVVLYEDGVPLDGEPLPLDGALEVRPKRTSVYRLEALNEGEGWDQAELTVEVDLRGPPRIEAFTASAAAVRKGAVVELAWKVVGADLLQIFADPGGFLGAPSEAEGSMVVHPTEATRYALRAINAEGLDTAEVFVAMGARPTVELTLDRERAVWGEEVELRWSVRDAARIVISDPDDDIVYDGPGEDGSLAIVARRSGAFLAVAEGVGGEARDGAWLGVAPWIETFTAVAQGEARPGLPVLATWSVHGADRVVLGNDLRDLWETDATSGSRTLPIGEEGTFVLRAWADTLVSEAEAVVELVRTPLIRRLAHGPIVTAGQGVVGASTIGWEVDGATHVRLVVEPGGEVDLTGKDPAMGEVVVLFTGPGTVTLTAYNDDGASEKTIPAPVDPVPTFAAVFAAPSRVAPGEQVSIHWDVPDAARVVVLQDDVPLWADEFAVPKGAYLVPTPIGSPTIFSLRAQNGLGYEVASAPVEVDLGPPEVRFFDTADGERIYRVSDRVELRWENHGGTELTIWDDGVGDVVFATTDPAAIRSGSTTLWMPFDPRDVSLVYEVKNGAGSEIRQLELRAVRRDDP